MCLLIWRGRLSALLINGRCEKDKNMKQFLSFVIKESKHILRDRRTMLILFGMPVMLMLLFGFAITTDVRNVRTVVVTSQMDHLTQQTVERLAQSEYFTITKAVATPKEAERLIRNQKADMAVVFGQDFASKKSGLQFIVDGSDPNMAQQWTNYCKKCFFLLKRRKSSTFVAEFMNKNTEIERKFLVKDDSYKCQAIRHYEIRQGYLSKEHGRTIRVRIRDNEAFITIKGPSVDGGRGQGCALFDISHRNSYYHSVDGPFCVGSASSRLLVLDYCRQHPLYPFGTLSGTAHLQYRPDAVGCSATFSYGFAHAYGDALWHALSRGVDAPDITMDLGRCTTTLLYSGYAQIDDYGSGHR